MGREDQNLLMLIKEAIYIRVNNPSLNRNIGKYHLPHIWDEVLFNISELINKKDKTIDRVAIPSATKAITSAIIKTIPSYMAIPSATMTIISAIL